MPDGVAAIPTMGWLSFSAPVEPWKAASPKEKMPPSDPTIQYPAPDGVAAIPTTGRLRGLPRREPRSLADPKG